VEAALRRPAAALGLARLRSLSKDAGWLALTEQQLLGLFTRVQLLHYLMAVALWLLARAPRADAAAVVVPAR
jgi:hypothetical protein